MNSDNAKAGDYCKYFQTIIREDNKICRKCIINCIYSDKLAQDFLIKKK